MLQKLPKPNDDEIRIASSKLDVAFPIAMENRLPKLQQFLQTQELDPAPRYALLVTIEQEGAKSKSYAAWYNALLTRFETFETPDSRSELFGKALLDFASNSPDLFMLPQFTDLALELSQSQIEAGNRDGALRFIERILSSLPNRVANSLTRLRNAKDNIAKELAEEKQFQIAMEHVAKDDSDQASWTVVGRWFLVKSGDWNGAKDAYAKSSDTSLKKVVQLDSSVSPLDFVADWKDAIAIHADDTDLVCQLVAVANKLTESRVQTADDPIDRKILENFAEYLKSNATGNTANKPYQTLIFNGIDHSGWEISTSGGKGGWRLTEHALLGLSKNGKASVSKPSVGRDTHLTFHVRLSSHSKFSAKVRWKDDAETKEAITLLLESDATDVKGLLTVGDKQEKLSAAMQPFKWITFDVVSHDRRCTVYANGRSCATVRNFINSESADGICFEVIGDDSFVELTDVAVGQVQQYAQSIRNVQGSAPETSKSIAWIAAASTDGPNNQIDAQLIQKGIALEPTFQQPAFFKSVSDVGGRSMRKVGRELIISGLPVKGKPQSHGVNFGDADWTNYRFSVEFRLEHGTREIGLVACSIEIPKDNFWSINTGAFQFDSLDLRANVDGQSSFRNPARRYTRGAGNFEQGTWYRMEMEVNGNEVFAFVNGKQIARSSHKQIQGGRVGVNVFDKPVVRFRNPKVVDLQGNVLLFGFPF
ncbi:hypothetical protein CGZ80_16830 [Rhodopirellula sp. MGV]|nr:hypothetical protein CGZ80_16830 [Rhodopirellula sp. MGV]